MMSDSLHSFISFCTRYSFSVTLLYPRFCPFFIQLQINNNGSFQLWVKDDHDLVVTVLQKSHTLRGFGLTPNVIA